MDNDYLIPGSTLTGIADAIREKGGTTDVIATEDMAAAIAAIEAGMALPTLTNPATAADIASGKQVIGPDGEIIKGGVYTVESGQFLQTAPKDVMYDSGDFYILYTEDNGRFYRAGANLLLLPKPSLFGDATAADVAAGKTFTSAAGLKVVGTAQIAGAVATLTYHNYMGVDVQILYVNPSTKKTVSETILASTETGTLSVPVGSFVFFGTAVDSGVPLYVYHYDSAKTTGFRRWQLQTGAPPDTADASDGTIVIVWADGGEIDLTP